MTTRIESDSLGDYFTKVKGLPKWDPKAPEGDCQLYRIEAGHDYWEPRCFGKKCKEGKECNTRHFVFRDKTGKEVIGVECCP